MAEPHCRIGNVKKRGNVYLLPGVTSPELPARWQPHGPTVAMLRTLLERAERGDLHRIAVAWVNSDGNTCTDWSGGSPFYPGTLMLGAIQALVQDYGTRVLNNCEVENLKEPS